MKEFSPLARQVANKYTKFTKLLNQQPDMAIGLGLFESLNIIQPLYQRQNYSIESLIDEVLL